MTRRSWSLLACVGWGATWIVVGEMLIVEMTSCTQGGTDAWLLHLLFGVPLTVAAVALLLAARRHERTTRWLALPHAVLLPAAAVLVARYLSLSTVHGISLCAIATGERAFDAYPQQWWNRCWAPAQAIVLIAVGTVIYLYWHRGSVDDRRQ
jgi:hypothetical protein